MDMVLLAIAAGGLVGLSRQLNGRLAMATSALHSSVWNHVVGLLFIVLVGLLWGGLFAGRPLDAPVWAYLGGPVGVLFIAAGSWAITRIGAARMAILIIAGQMISGVILDLAMGAPGAIWARVTGVALILAGMWLAQPARARSD